MVLVTVVKGGTGDVGVEKDFVGGEGVVVLVTVVKGGTGQVVAEEDVVDGEG